MANSNITFGELKIGTVLSYSDFSNVGREYIILDSYTDRFGHWTNMIEKETNSIEPVNARGIVNPHRWTIVSNA